MSLKAKEKEMEIASNISNNELNLRETLLQIVQSYSSFFTIKRKPDIYLGNENIPFEQRHPIFKSIMKLEFQKALLHFERK